MKRCLVFLSLAGCTAMLRFDDLRYDDEAPSVTTSTTGSAAGGAGGGGDNGGTTATAGASAGGSGAGSTGPPALWSKRFGGLSDERLAGLEVMPDGGILLAGSYRGAPAFGGIVLPDMAVTYQPGPFGVFGVRLDADGLPTFGRGVGDATYDHVATDLALTSTGAVVVGSFEGKFDLGSALVAKGTDAFILELPSAGGDGFSGAFGGNGSEHAWGVATTASGGIVIAGDYDSASTFGTFGLNSFGATDVFVSTLDAAGHVTGATGYGDGIPQYARSVATDAATGRFAVAGIFWGKMAFGGSCSELQSAGGNDLFIAVFSQTGGCIWARSIGDASDQTDTAEPDLLAAPRVAFRPSGNLVVAGAFQGSADFGTGLLAAAGECPYVAEYSANAEPLYGRTFVCAGKSAVEALHVTDAATVLVGSFDTSVDFGGGLLASAGKRDAFVVRLTNQAAYVASRRYGDASDQRATGVAITVDGDTILGGSFTGTIDFGNGTLVNPDGSDNTTDVFVAKLVL